MDQKLLQREVYAVPFRADTLVYAPLTRCVALYEGAVGLEEIDPEWFATATDPTNVPAFIEEKGFAYDSKKIRLRLNITSRCNLACSYCSVSASSQGCDMPISTAIAAVKEFVVYGNRLGSRELEIVFSGGEPTLRLDYIAEVIQSAQKEPADGALKLSPRILSNGLFSPWQIVPMSKLFQEVQVSWDGDSGNNPRYGSRPSIAQHVWENLLALLRANIPVSVLTVVSGENYLYLPQIVENLYDAGVRHIFLALEDSLGRATGRKVVLNHDQLAEIYLGIWHEYKKKGVEINLTGTDVHSISSFPCSVPVPNYSVAPDGKISACTIAFNDPSERAELFQIGNLSNGRLVLDSERMLSVRKFNVLNMEGCSKCFAKWHCRGGCPYSRQREWPAPLNSERCGLVRTILAEKIYEMMREG
jgi:radical SAM protein with 4Fe4S-binding SPASM domain